MQFPRPSAYRKIWALVAFLSRVIELEDADLQQVQSGTDLDDLLFLMYRTIDEEFGSGHSVYNTHMVGEHILEER